MIIGHYAAALIPHSYFKKVPLWYFLVVANLPDFLWMTLALLGIEETKPQHFWQASFDRIQVQMLYSHDLLPGLFLALVVALLTFLFFKRGIIALVSAALILLHHVADWVSGFPHYWMGPGSLELGWGLYYREPYLALVLEALFASALVFLYLKLEARHGRPKSRAYQLKLYLLFILGSLMWLPTARYSMSELYQFFVSHT
ncbi:MAG: hypothetical protein KDK66_00010 [Deltaproteobacteria bacterium]|nr:hypothetical protein [Deltaproteobacteria bacterium]